MRRFLVSVLSLVFLVSGAGPAHAVTASAVTHTVSVGSSPIAVAVTHDGTRAVVANYGSASVSIVDTSLGTVLHTVSVNNRPSGVAISADDTTAYVAVYGDFGTPTTSQIVVITIATGTVTKTLTSANGLGSYPTDIIIGPDPNIIYAYTTAPSQWISRVNLTTDTFTTFGFGGSSIAEAALSPDGTRLILVPLIAGGNTEVVNANTMSLVTSASLGKRCSHVAFSPDGTTAYVTHPDDDDMSVVTVSTLAFTNRTTAGDQPQAVAVATSGNVYVGNFGDGTLATFAGSTTSVVSGLSGPIELILTPDQGRVIVANYSNATVTLIRTSDLASETLSVGNSPLGIATTNRTLVVANYASGTVSIIQLGDLPASGDQVPTAPMQQYARAEGATCGVDVPDTVLLPGIGRDQRRDAWGASWAQWPNAGAGGFVCTRQPYYTSSGGWSVR